MSRDTRDAALRRLLVARATRDPQRRPWPAIVGTVAVVALLGGVAIGATAFRPAEVPPAVAPIDLPFFISEESQIIGAPMVVTTSDAVAYEAGQPPVRATGLAVWADCAEGGTFDVEVDGRPDLGGSCLDTGGGFLLFQPHGPNVVRVTPHGGPATITIAWIDRQNDTSPNAEAEAALADGVITEDEYRAAFDRFTTCMEAWGAPVGGIFWTPSRVEYSMSADHRKEGAFHECYGTEFMDIDVTWQLAHPVRSEEATLALLDGVTRDEYLAAFDRWEACLAALGASATVADRDAEMLQVTVNSNGAPPTDVAHCYTFEFFDVDMMWQAALEE